MRILKTIGIVAGVYFLAMLVSVLAVASGADSTGESGGGLDLGY